MLRKREDGIIIYGGLGSVRGEEEEEGLGYSGDEERGQMT